MLNSDSVILRLLLGAGLGLAQFAFLDGRLLLAPVGLDLLDGDLARAQLDQDGLDLRVARRRGGRADQHFFQLQVVVRELFLHLLAGLLLDGAALLHQLDQRARLADVLEVGRDHRVERLFDQLLDVAEALDHQRGLLVVDVDHHRERQRGLEGILGDQRDLGQVLVKAGASRPRCGSTSG